LLEESGDLVFRLNGYIRQGCDDAGCLEFGGGDLYFRMVLVRLLEQWREAVTGLRSGETASLPYEFQDEYTGWLPVVAVDEQQVDCLPINCSISGWFVDPLSNREWHGGWEPVDYRPGWVPVLQIMCR
jgi:hypothetical protein